MSDETTRSGTDPAAEEKTGEASGSDKVVRLSDMIARKRTEKNVLSGEAAKELRHRSPAAVPSREPSGADDDGASSRASGRTDSSHASVPVNERRAGSAAGTAVRPGASRRNSRRNRAAAENSRSGSLTSEEAFSRLRAAAAGRSVRNSEEDEAEKNAASVEDAELSAETGAGDPAAASAGRSGEKAGESESGSGRPGRSGRKSRSAKVSAEEAGETEDEIGEETGDDFAEEDDGSVDDFAEEDGETEEDFGDEAGDFEDVSGQGSGVRSVPAHQKKGGGSSGQTVTSGKVIRMTIPAEEEPEVRTHIRRGRKPARSIGDVVGEFVSEIPDRLGTFLVSAAGFFGMLGRKLVDHIRNSRIPLRVRIRLAVAGILVILILFAASLRVTNVTFEGNTRYQESQLQELIFGDGFYANPIIFKIRELIDGHAELPFVEKYTVELTGLRSAEVTVYEKSIAGYVQVMGSYMYFDKDGYVVESSSSARADIPRVTGLNSGSIVLDQKMTGIDDEVFQETLNITQFLQSTTLTRDGKEVTLISLLEKLDYDSSYCATCVYTDGLCVYLGSSDYMEEKLMEMADIMPELEGKTGTLYLDTYDPSVTEPSYLFKDGVITGNDESDEEGETAAEGETTAADGSAAGGSASGQNSAAGA